MTERKELSDIWLCALMLCNQGAKLDAVSVERGKKETVKFAITGVGLEEIEVSYSEKTITANVTELRNQLNFLRDIIFQLRSKGVGK